MSRFYNQSLKEEFLNSFSNEGTVKTYERVFERTKEEEERIGLDLSEFNLSDIERVIYALQPQTRQSAYYQGTILNSYITWAKARGFGSNISPLSLVVNRAEYYSKFTLNQKLFYTDEELTYLEDNLVNSQDEVIIRSLFLGITMHELLNIKEDDINFEEGLINLEDDKGNKRILEFHGFDRKRLFRVIQGALLQEKYLGRNGSYESRRGPIVLMDTPYLIKKGNVGESGLSNKPSYHILSQRLTTIREMFRQDYYNLTPLRIAQSGMLRMARDIIIRDGKLKRPQFLEIGNYFNVLNNESQYLSIASVTNVVNIDNLMKLYPEVTDRI